MAEKKKTACFLGRFQPVHRGLISVVEDLLKDYETVVIAICSSDKFRTPENPFTVGERHAMFKETLVDELKYPRTRLKVVPVPDIDDDEKWPKHVLDVTGGFDVLVTGTKSVAELFEKKTKKKVIAPKKKYAILGDQVIAALKSGESMDKYCHKAVISFLQKIGAARKILPEIELAQQEAAKNA